AGRRGLVPGLSERIDAVEQIVAPAVPERLTEEGEAIGGGRSVARGRPPVGEEGRSREAAWAAEVGRVVRSGTDANGYQAGQDMRGRAIVVDEMTGGELLTGR